ncbi:hypothetical protein HDV04_000648 [Boothiomyces sp. JEL0838]|nr:hypothetical protein HDV04_000648 [Boothiomyces sp. JEL0838]
MNQQRDKGTRDTYFSLPIRKDSVRINQQLDPFQKHKLLMKYYKAPKLDKQKSLTEVQILKKNHQFLRDEEAETWEERLAEKYYSKLFKEYCLGDFSRYKTGAIGLRWRTEKECISGKGQFICGNLNCENDELKSWEVNFAYMEKGEKKNALVKIRLCPECSDCLNYKKLKDSKKLDMMEQKDLERKRKIEAKDEERKKLKEDEEEGDGVSNGNIWSAPIKEPEQVKSTEEEMDDYLKELFM